MDSNHRLQFVRTVEDMSDIVYCPKVECGTPTANGDPTSNNMKCAQCYHRFCITCKQPAHQGRCENEDNDSEPESIISQIPRRIKRIFVKPYESTETDSNARKRRRKKRLENLKNLAELHKTSKKCPGCKTWIYKMSGCDHMTCQKCYVSTKISVNSEIWLHSFKDLYNDTQSYIDKIFFRVIFVGNVEHLENHTFNMKAIIECAYLDRGSNLIYRI